MDLLEDSDLSSFGGLYTGEIAEFEFSLNC